MLIRCQFATVSLASSCGWVGSIYPSPHIAALVRYIRSLSLLRGAVAARPTGGAGRGVAKTPPELTALNFRPLRLREAIHLATRPSSERLQPGTERRRAGTLL